MDPSLMGNDDAAAVFAVLGGFFIFIIIALIIVEIFYLLTLYKALNLAGENNRGMTPGLVFLNLIPIFNLGWHFYTVAKVSEAVRNKFSEAGSEDAGDGGWGLGLALSILAVVSIIPIPIINLIIALATFVMWIIYWVKIAGFNKAMASMGGNAGTAGV